MLTLLLALSYTPKIKWWQTEVAVSFNVLADCTTTPEVELEPPVADEEKPGDGERGVAGGFRFKCTDAKGAEATLASGPSLKRWCALATDSFVEQTRQGVHLVATRPLIGFQDEDAVIDYDEGLPGVAARDCERAGITHDAGSEEKILKHGSVFRARVTTQGRT